MRNFVVFLQGEMGPPGLPGAAVSVDTPFIFLHAPVCFVLQGPPGNPGIPGAPGTVGFPGREVSETTTHWLSAYQRLISGSKR
jgi:hypothetical protein